MITQITSSEASIEEMQAEDINTEDLTAIHIRGIGTGISTVDFDGTLNVDGATTLGSGVSVTGDAGVDGDVNVTGNDGTSYSYLYATSVSEKRVTFNAPVTNTTAV